jgi:selenocysteine lyase/cysteine desulfurase
MGRCPRILESKGASKPGAHRVCNPYRIGVTVAVRASRYAYTTAEEVDLLVAALQEEHRGFS